MLTPKKEKKNLFHPGFTLTELIIVMAILGGVAVAAGPSFNGMLGTYRLNEQATDVSDLILEARNYSLAKRVCPTSQKAAHFWGINLNTTTGEYHLTCEDSDGTLEMVKTHTLKSDITQTLQPRTGDNPQTSADINFLTQSLSSEIFFEGLDTFEEDLRIILSNGRGDRTICLNAVQAFPTFNQNGTTCP